MNNGWRYFSLGEILKRSSETLDLQSNLEYKEITARLWGKGVVLRGLISGVDIAAKKRYIARNGQFIISRIDARHGSMGIIPHELDGAIVTNDFPLYNISTDIIEPKYLNWIIKTKFFIDLCKRASEGTTNRVRLKEDRFLQLKIQLPPLAEQRSIVEWIEKIALRNAEVCTLRKSLGDECEKILSQIVSTILDEETKWGHVRDIVSQRKGSIRSGPFGSQLHHEEFVSSGVAAIGIRDVHENQFKLCSGWYVTPERFRDLSRYQIYQNDLLCTIVGSIGRFCVVPENSPLAFTTKHILALTLELRNNDPLFSSYMLNYHIRCRKSLLSKVEGSVQPCLNAEKVLAIDFPNISLEHQKQIVMHLDTVQRKILELRNSQELMIFELNLLIPSVLDKVMSGGSQL